MVADRNEIAVERPGKGLVGSAEHAEDVGGMAARWVRRDDRLAGAGADQHRRQHRRGGDQPQGVVRPIAVGYQRDAGAHAVVERQRDQAGKQLRRPLEHRAARRAKRADERGVGRQRVEEAVEEQRDDGLVGHMAGDFVERMTANDEMPADAVDIGQDCLGRHHII